MEWEIRFHEVSSEVSPDVTFRENVYPVKTTMATLLASDSSSSGAVIGTCDNGVV